MPDLLSFQTSHQEYLWEEPPTYPSAYRQLEKNAYPRVPGQQASTQTECPVNISVQVTNVRRPVLSTEAFVEKGYIPAFSKKQHVLLAVGRTIATHRQGRTFWMKAGGMKDSRPDQLQTAPVQADTERDVLLWMGYPCIASVRDHPHHGAWHPHIWHFCGCCTLKNGRNSAWAGHADVVWELHPAVLHLNSEALPPVRTSEPPSSSVSDCEPR